MTFCRCKHRFLLQSFARLSFSVLLDEFFEVQGRIIALMLQRRFECAC